MKGYGQLTLAQLRLFLRNRQVLFWTLMFPIFLMVMLGSFLGNGTQVSVSGYVLDLDQTDRSEQFVAAMESIEQALNLESSELKVEQAVTLLEEGEIDVLLVVPEGYGAAVEAAERTAIDVYFDTTNPLIGGLAFPAIERVIDSFDKQVVAYEPVIVAAANDVKADELQFIDFLVPGIVAMMIMTNNMNGVAGQIASWRERGVLRRMQSTTLKASTFIAAQITARLVLNGLQALIVLLVANLFFDTQVNGSWLLLLLFVVAGTLAFMSIGFIIAGIAKTPESAAPIAGFLSFPMLFLGGVFFSISSMPEFLQPVVKSLPIAQLSTALREVMNSGASLLDLWVEAGLLGLWMVIAFVIATRVFRWE